MTQEHAAVQEEPHPAAIEPPYTGPLEMAWSLGERGCTDWNDMVTFCRLSEYTEERYTQLTWDFDPSTAYQELLTEFLNEHAPYEEQTSGAQILASWDEGSILLDPEKRQGTLQTKQQLSDIGAVVTLIAATSKHAAHLKGDRRNAVRLGLGKYF